MRNFQKKKRTTTKNQRRKTIFTQVKEGKRKETKIKGGGSIICCAVTWPLWKEKKRPREISKNAIQRYSTEPDAQTHTGITRIVYIILLI